MFKKYLLLVLSFIALTSVNSAYSETEVELVQNKAFHSSKKISYKELYQRIYSGKATLEHVELALTTKDKTKIINTIHALYAMRWHIGVKKLLYKMWEVDIDTAPNINWKTIQETDTRIAIASTINRIDTLKSKAFRNYIRSHKYDSNIKIQGQVLVALGLNGDPADVAYLQEVADGNNRYLTQVSVSSLAFMGNSTAKDSLVVLAKKHHDKPRGKLILEVLSRAYNVVPISKEQAEAEGQLIN